MKHRRRQGMKNHQAGLMNHFWQRKIQLIEFLQSLMFKDRDILKFEIASIHKKNKSKG
jgi:hypothetical protein